MIVRVSWQLFLAFLPLQLHAAEIRALHMETENGGYRVHAETFLQAPPQVVFSMLLNYDQFHRLSAGITASRWLDETLDGLPLAYTRIDSCVAFFCRKLEKVEKVTITSTNEIRTEVLPERSDFRYNRTRWRLEPEDGGTKILYDLEMEPDFWVPPLIGPWAIKRKARKSALNIAERLEYLHRTGTALDTFDLKSWDSRR